MRIARLVVATHNPRKGVEMRQIVAARFPALEILTLADFPAAPEPEEDGATYAENALIKARNAARRTGEWSLADDAGLEIDFFGGEPGLHSKRFMGEDTPFPEKMAAILERMGGVPDERRGARFRCCIALVSPEGEEVLFQDVCEGRIAHAPAGEGGFGYDPIFWHPSLGCTMAELSAAQKHEVSHRGKVLRALGVWLERRG